MAKFNFIPERQLKSENNDYSPAILTIQVVTVKGVIKGVNLRFPRETIEMYDLNNKLIRLYGDRENRTIGFAIIDQKMSIEGLEDVYQLKQYSQGHAQVGITRLLYSMGIELEKTLSNLEVKKYKSTMHEYEILYVEIPTVEKPYKPQE